LGVALAKTAGSMLVAAVVYYFFLFHNVTIAVGVCGVDADSRAGARDRDEVEWG